MNTSEFQKLITNCKKEEELSLLLAMLLTDKERLEIERRISIIHSLQNGQTQRAVAEELGVGIATVTRGAKILQNSQFKKLMERIFQNG